MMRQECSKGVLWDRYGPHQPWLRQRTLQELCELNEKSLEMFHDQVLSGERASAPMIESLGDLWLALDPAARRLAAALPYSLVDAGFDDVRRWEGISGDRVHDQARPASLFTIAGARAVSRHALTFAWHLAHGQTPAARLLLGMSTECIERISACSINQITVLGERHPEWLRPRWATRVSFWRDLLRAAISADLCTLAELKVYGLQLLASERRLAATS